MPTLKEILKRPEKSGRIYNVRFVKMDGERGIFQTVEIMKQLKEHYKNDIRVRTTAMRLVNVNKIHDDKENARNIYSYLFENIRYIPDTSGTEVLQSPIYTMKYKGGDCDDMSIIGASFLESIGINTIYVIVGNNGVWSHIYLYFSYKGKWIPFDLTLGRFGVESNRYAQKKIM